MSSHHVPIVHPSNPSHPSCSAAGNPLRTQTQCTFSTAEPASSTMTSQQAANITILPFQGPELPWKPLNCHGSRDGIPHPHPREDSGGELTSGWVWTPIPGLTMALPAPPKADKQQESFRWEKTSRISKAGALMPHGGTESPIPILSAFPRGTQPCLTTFI